MQPLIDITREQALDEALALARRLRLDVHDPRILNARHNLVVWLAPSPVVARIGWITSLLRGPERAAQSLALAEHLANAGLPVTRPASSVDPGPHVLPSGCIVTLWDRVGVRDDPVDATALGRQLRRLHDVAASYAGRLERLDPLGEAIRVTELTGPYHPDLSVRVRTLAEAQELPQLHEQPIHGDAGFHNAFATRDGLVWGDWEECAIGPVAWDLATLAHRSRVLGERNEEIATALDAYGPSDAEAVDRMAPVFSTWAAAWGLLAAVRDGGPVGEQTIRRLEWAERHAEGMDGIG